VGEGYGDGNLRARCPYCEVDITKELLSVAKFVEDAKALLLKGVPMPGTILEPSTGEPTLIPPGPGGITHARTFPNRMIKNVLRADIAELLNPRVYPNPSMETVRGLIEGVLTDQTKLRLVNNPDAEPVTSTMRYYIVRPVARICVRKMMSRYWDNFSPFALDLSGAVMRQGIFVEK